MIGKQLADVSTRCCSHLQSESEARPCVKTYALIFMQLHTQGYTLIGVAC